MKKLTKKDVWIQVFATEEDLPPSSDYDDPELVKYFGDMIEKHGLWGYCQVEICVTWQGIQASEWLGCCSYESEEDFIKNSGYYDDMVEGAIQELNEEIAKSVELFSTRLTSKELAIMLEDRLDDEKNGAACKLVKNLIDLLG